jgi:hypothetical protein
MFLANPTLSFAVSPISDVRPVKLQISWAPEPWLLIRSNFSAEDLSRDPAGLNSGNLPLGALFYSMKMERRKIN